VTDQIRLWEKEKNRLEATTGYLFRDFNSVQDYTMVVDYASELGWVIWSNKQKGMFFCRDEGKGTVIEFVDRKITKSSSGHFGAGIGVR
jgi:transcription initiation factor TFIIH subunit 4